MESTKWAPEQGQLERVREGLLSQHQDEEICYALCPQNGCWDVCMLKTRVKDGVATAIETDSESIHPNTGREDEYCDFSDFEKGLYQKRACVRGRGLRADAYSPNRILYPMKRVGPKGTRQFERISWDEALDTIANKYLETREKYGPLSVWTDGMMGSSWDPWSGYLPGGGIATWGEDSYEPTNFADDVMYGRSSDVYDPADGIAEMQTYFDTKLIILFGIDTAINFTERVYYELLAKERGIPIIVIDPRFTWTAQAIGTQWIPIRPGTDMAMILGMLHVIFEENLVDHEFIQKMVEPKGYQKYFEYVMGYAPGEIPKTPEWAEGICGVPAETIRELARLYGTTQPTYIRMVWSAARSIYGKDTARAFNILQCVCGNIGKKGCAGNGTGVWHMAGRMPFPFPGAFTGSAPRPYEDTVCMEAECWEKAILLRPKMEAGDITEEEYKESIGCSINSEAPNIHMICSIPSNRNHVTGWYGASQRIEALKKVDFFAYAHWNMTAPSIPYADIVLPYAQQGIETLWSPTTIGSYGISSGINAGTKNHFLYGRGTATPPGEARSMWWIVKEIGKRLGIGDVFMTRFIDAGVEEIDDAMEDVVKDSYEYWRAEINDPNAKPWEEFKKEPIYRKSQDDYYVYLMNEYENGVPLKTKSGKIEFFSDFIAENDLRAAKICVAQKQLGTNSIQPYPIWRKSPQGMLSPRVKDYPLYMVTPHSIFRQHTAYEHSLWFRDEYRNSVWMSVADAKARNIEDGDKVRVFSDSGECHIPAYVTSRMTPGVCCIIFGRWYEPSGVKTELMPDGVDMRGDCNLLISPNFYGDALGACLSNGLVEVQKLEPDLQLDLVSDYVLGEEGLQ